MGIKRTDQDQQKQPNRKMPIPCKLEINQWLSNHEAFPYPDASQKEIWRETYKLDKDYLDQYLINKRRRSNYQGSKKELQMPQFIPVLMRITFKKPSI